MRLTALILLAGTLHVSATCFSQKINITVQKIPLEKAFELIEQQSGYSFFFRYNDLQHSAPANLLLKDATIDEAMNAVLKDQPLEYSIRNNTISIKRKAAPLPSQPPLSDVHGIVLDQNGVPLPGVSVAVKGGGGGTVTDSKGAFLLRNVADGAVLVFSYIGYAQEERKAASGRAMEIRLKPLRKDLSQVVVTALGIRKEERSLGYAAQTVSGKDVSEAPSANWINSLSGKVPGLNLNKVGGPLGSSDIILRGDNALALGESGALIVVDGIPVSSSMTGTGHGAYLGNDAPIDFGSQLTDLQPEDIESISVLKGPGAAALYGSRASNGAIIITTKSGKKTPGLGVSFSTSFMVDEVNNWPDYQFEYGAGAGNAKYYSYGPSEDGASTKSATANWGPRFAGQSYYQYNSPYDQPADGSFADPTSAKRTARTPWVPYRDTYRAFFRKGLTTSSTIDLTGPNFRSSITYNKNEWILPNTGYQRVSAWLSGSQKISSKITLNGKLNYNRKWSDNLPSMGYNNQTIMYFMMQNNPNIDVRWYKPEWLPGKQNVQQLSLTWGGMDNPYVITSYMLNGSDRHGVIGNLNALVQLSPRLTLSLRSGLDMSFENRTQQRPKSTYKFVDGMYRTQNVFSIETNSDFLLTYKHALKGGWHYSASLGGNQRWSTYKYVNTRADKLVLPGVYNIANNKDPIQVSNSRWELLVNSLYGFLNIDYKEKVFLELTGRNDWSSTLPANNASFFYPSANTSVLLDKIFRLPRAFTMAKVRASYAVTGQDARATYNFDRNLDKTNFTGALTFPGSLANPDLKPRFTYAVETGVDFRFFDDRLGLDAALYRNNTKNQILNMPIDPSSGFSSAIVNFGSVLNKGMEVMLRGTPLKRPGGLRWDVTLNWSANRNRVLHISAPGVVDNTLQLFKAESTMLMAVEGQPLGMIYGTGFERSPDGQLVYDANGYPKTGTEIKSWGSVYPSWKGGIRNQLSYRGISFSCLFDVRNGGKAYSLTNALSGQWGKFRSTLPGREDGITGKGVQENADGTYSPNTVHVSPNAIATYYDRLYSRANTEANTLSTSFVKLREVTLSYSLPAKLLRRISLQGATIGVFGRDLYTWSKFTAYDPETVSLNSSQIVPGMELAQFPSTRTIGMNLNVKF